MSPVFVSDAPAGVPDDARLLPISEPSGPGRIARPAFPGPVRSTPHLSLPSDTSARATTEGDLEEGDGAADGPAAMPAQSERSHIEQLLDEALEESFPASDPPSIQGDDHVSVEWQSRPERPQGSSL
jgi:hypothetical protein